MPTLWDEPRRNPAPEDLEPDRAAKPYQWVLWWHRQPQNQEASRELRRGYIAAMQKDTNLD